MQAKIKSFITTSILTSILLAILGLIIAIHPVESLDIIRWSLTVFLLAVGSYHATVGAASRTGLTGGVTGGVICIVLGIVLAINPGIMKIFPILLGIWFIVSACNSFRLSAALRGSSAYTIAIITAIASFICGTVLIINPGGSAVGLTSLAGILICASAITSIIDLSILHHNVSVIAKELKSFFGRPAAAAKSSAKTKAKSVQEAQVVKKKSTKK